MWALLKIAGVSADRQYTTTTSIDCSAQLAELVKERRQLDLIDPWLVRSRGVPQASGATSSRSPKCQRCTWSCAAYWRRRDRTSSAPSGSERRGTWRALEMGRVASLVDSARAPSAYFHRLVEAVVPADIGHDDSAVAEAELERWLRRLAALLESETRSRAQAPLRDIRIDEDGIYNSRRNGAVVAYA